MRAWRFKRGFVHKSTGRVIIADANIKARGWKEEVRKAAWEQYQGKPLSGTLEVTFQFVMSRPKHHYGKGKKVGILKPSAPRYHTVKPDVTKLVRSTEDALTSIIWSDDAVIAIQHASKEYVQDARGDLFSPGVWITVKEIEGITI